VPDRVREAGRGFLARPEGTSRPTVGAFQGQEIQSGGRDRSIAQDLDYGPLPGAPVTFYQHAELVRVSPATARRAVVEYVSTGLKPTSVSWVAG
jgi:hypothetical protein